VPYKPDPNGGWVIGYGHEIKVGEDFNKGLTNQQVENLFQEDLASHTKMAKDVVDTFKGNKPGTFSKLPIETQNVLVDMAFSMGKNGLKKYEDFLSAVQNKNKSKMIANVGRGGVSKERTDWAIDSILKSKFK
jgi:GH24 family phage-related lysozyme (muramidase)